MSKNKKVNKPNISKDKMKKINDNKPKSINRDNFLNDIDNLMNNFNNQFDSDFKDSNKDVYETKTYKNGRLESITRTTVDKNDNLIVTQRTSSQNKAYKEICKKNEELKERTNLLGGFCFFKYDYKDKVLKDLDGKEESYAIYLSRFFRLVIAVMKNSRRKYYIKDLPELWKTNASKAKATYNLFLDLELINLNKDGAIMMNEDIVRKYKGYNTKYPETYTMLFFDGNEDFYESLSSKQKKYYGYVHAILNYVNFKYNVLCFNPTETDESKLELMDWKDLCDIVGYDKKNSYRLSKDLLKLKVNDSAVFMAHTDFKGTRITINPSLYYSGDRPEDLDYLFKLFKMNPKKNK